MIGDKGFSPKNNMQKGVTIIELLVTIIVFAIVITGFLNLFSYAFKAQIKVLDSQHLLANTAYVSEYISRSLRMARKDIIGNCITAKYNFENPSGQENAISFLNYEEICQEFLLSDNSLQVKKSINDSASSLQEGLPLFPSDINVEDLKFQIAGETQDDKLQPKVTFIIKLQTSRNPPQEFNFQTTISQRNLDVFY